MHTIIQSLALKFKSYGVYNIFTLELENVESANFAFVAGKIGRGMEGEDFVVVEKKSGRSTGSKRKKISSSEESDGESTV